MTMFRGRRRRCFPLCCWTTTTKSLAILVLFLSLSTPSTTTTTVSGFRSTTAIPHPSARQSSYFRLYDSSKHETAAALEFACIVGKLKTTPREGWRRRGVSRYESVADHSLRVAALCFLLPSYYDITKTLPMAVIHDLAEALVGDITPDDTHISKSQKQQLEHAAMDQILSLISRYSNDTTFVKVQLLQLFQEYEDRSSPEAKAVKDLDKLDMLLQADVYEQQYYPDNKDLSDFFDSTPVSSFFTPEIRQLAAAVHDQRDERMLSSKKKEENAESSGGTTIFLSASDQAFVTNYSSDLRMSHEDIEKVVGALRAWDDQTAEEE